MNTSMCRIIGPVFVLAIAGLWPRPAQAQTGACCSPYTTPECQVMTLGECDQVDSGLYQGNGTICSNFRCGYDRCDLAVDADFEPITQVLTFISGSLEYNSDSGHPSSCGPGWDVIDEWYALQFPCITVVNSSLCTGTSFDSTLEIDEWCYSSFPWSACNDNFDCDDVPPDEPQSEVTWIVDPEHGPFQYYVRVGGPTADGNYLLRIEILEPTPNNNSCSIAAVAVDGLQTFDNYCTSTDGPEEPILCNDWGVPQINYDVWYRYTASCTGTVEVNLCDTTNLDYPYYDTKIAIYEDAVCPDPGVSDQAIACNDDACGPEGKQSLVTFDAVAGGDYLIRIGGRSWHHIGQGNMLITCDPAPEGACCYTDGSCLQQAQIVCENGGGVYRGDGMPCDPDPCNPCNPLVNPGFDHLGGSFTGWSTWGNRGIAVEPDPYHSAPASAWMRGNDPDPPAYNHSGIHQVFPASPGATYRITGYSLVGQPLTGESNTVMRITYYDDQGGWAGSDQLIIADLDTTAGEWHYDALDVTAPGNAWEVDALFIFRQPCADGICGQGEVYVDDATLTRIDPVAVCDDGDDLCTLGDTCCVNGGCEAGECVGTPVECDPGEVCVPGAGCVVPTGACCTGSTCVPDLTDGECTTLGGVHQGGGTECDPDPCLPAVYLVNALYDEIDYDLDELACADSQGNCTLRAAIMQANHHTGPDTIVLPAGTYILDVQGPDGDASAGDLDITDSVILAGAGADVTIVDASGLIDPPDRVFHVLEPAFLVQIKDLAVQHGNASSGNGGGILSTRNLVLDSLTVRNCSAEFGGGIYQDGAPAMLQMTACALHDNSALYDGGIGAGGGASVTVTNSTISGNSAGEGGSGLGVQGTGSTLTLNHCNIVGNQGALAGIYSSSQGSVTLKSTIVADNTPPNCDALEGSFVSQGYNLADDSTCFDGSQPGDQPDTEPLLGPLQDNGGPTWTHAPEGASPAIDNGPSAGCPLADQRGFPRPVNDVCDIGAVEYRDCNDNLSDDGTDTAGGSSEDCDANDIPDECDMADCPAEDLECDDCNLDGVPDGCEGPGGDLAECVEPIPGVNWSDDIWGLEGQYPDNQDGVGGLHVTLDGGDIDLLVDVTVEIQTLRLQNDATLRVTQETVGDLTTVDPGGILVEAQLLTGGDRLIDASSGAVTIGQGGSYEAAGRDGTRVSASLLAGNILVLSGPSGNMGRMSLTDSMMVDCAGSFRMLSVEDEGTDTPPILTIGGTAIVAVGGDLVLDGPTEMACGAGAQVVLDGDFVNLSTDPSIFDWVDGALEMSDTVRSAQFIEAAAEDRGPCPVGLVNNFVIGTLTLAPDAGVTVVDAFDNQQDGSASCDEVLYVNTLIVNGGATLSTDGCKVYYGELVNNGGSIPGLGVDVLQIPEPEPADLSGDCVVNGIDLAMLLGSWGPGSCPADLDGNDEVDSADLALLLGAWGP